jgi:hypothetical protein
LARSWIFGFYFLANYFWVLKLALMGNRCSTNSRFNTGISWYSHVKQSAYSLIRWIISAL